jgi:hypothetical protein
VRAKPAVDVDAADRGVHAAARMMRTHLVDGVLGQVGEFAVVDGNVGFAARRIGMRRAPGTSRSIWASTCCMRAKWCALVAASCWYIFDSALRLNTGAAG